MRLTDDQLAQFDRDGFLLFPDLFSADEVEILRADVARLATVEADHIFRERTGGVRTIFRVHETDGATRSTPSARSRGRRGCSSPRCRCSATRTSTSTTRRSTRRSRSRAQSGSGTRTTATGTGTASDRHHGDVHGQPRPRDRARRLPLPRARDTQARAPGALRRRGDDLVQAVDDREGARDRDPRELARPRAHHGPPGTGALFHCNILHGSGHNLSAHDRWQVTTCSTPSPTGRTTSRTPGATTSAPRTSSRSG